MTSKYQRPTSAFTGASGLANRTKYQDDAAAVPKRAIASAKMDGDLNYLIDALNQIDEASGARASINERLNVVLNPDGSLKASVTSAMDEFIVHGSPGTLARVSDTSFSLNGGDYRSLYSVNRRVKLIVGGNGLVGDVLNCAYSAGLTTVTVADLVDGSSSAAVISAAPTQVAYGPLTPGSFGNTSRRIDSLKIPASGADYQLVADTTDLVVKRGASVVVRVGSGGLSGLAAGSVAAASLASDVTINLVPVGAVMPFAGSSAPTGWLLCAGQTVSRTTYATLFAAVGTAYGAGDGSTTFALPDLRGRAVFGVDNMGGTTASRVTSGVSGITGTTLGASGGNQAMHQHTHTVTDPGHTHVLTNGLNRGSGTGYYQGGPYGAAYTATESATTGITLANSGTGSSQNMPPAMMLNYIIKV